MEKLVMKYPGRARWSNGLVITGEKINVNEFSDFLNFLKEQEKGMTVIGELCKHVEYCFVRDPNCLDSKASHCIAGKRLNRAYKIMNNYKQKIKGLNGETPDNVSYYLDLAERRIKQGKLPNAGIYLRIIKRKLEEQDGRL